MPDWIAETVRDWQQRLLLHEWQIELSRSPHPDGDASGMTKAQVSVWPDIRLAQIEMLDKLPDEYSAEWERTIVHELLHVRLGEITDFVQRVVWPQFADATADILDNQFRRTVEPTVELLARIMTDAS